MISARDQYLLEQWENQRSDNLDLPEEHEDGGVESEAIETFRDEPRTFDEFIFESMGGYGGRYHSGIEYIPVSEHDLEDSSRNRLAAITKETDFRDIRRGFIGFDPDKKIPSQKVVVYSEQLVTPSIMSHEIGHIKSPSHSSTFRRGDFREELLYSSDFNVDELRDDLRSEIDADEQSFLRNGYPVNVHRLKTLAVTYKEFFEDSEFRAFDAIKRMYEDRGIDINYLGADDWDKQQRALDKGTQLFMF